MAILFAQPATQIPPTPSSPPTNIPPIVYRVHRLNAQTRYSFAAGFSAKNQTTILNYTSALSRFGLAHLCQQTNISSPFISVYDNLQHAENVAQHWAEKWGEEVLVVSNASASEADEWLHWGEYLIMYRIPAQAIRDQTPIGRGKEAWRAVGVIGGV
ncbi:hypothetical protein N0V86_003755 [Didymella sp. IMI 355093]|nr:hypothetical protein N0V86_003755 [Didymella sp. IMI 355093]